MQFLSLKIIAYNKIKISKTISQNQKQKSMLSKEKFIKSVQNPNSLKVLLKHSRYSQIKYSKQIYNRDARKIALFKQDALEFQRKFKLATEESKMIKELKEEINHYDENQLKELGFRVGARVQTMPHEEIYMYEQDELNAKKKKSGLKDRRMKFRKLPSIYSKKSPQQTDSVNSANQANYHLNRNRGKSLSQSNSNDPKSMLSPLKLRRKANTIFQNHQNLFEKKEQIYRQDQKVKLDPKLLQKAISHLQDIIYDKQKPLTQKIIHQQQINEKIRQKYHMGFPDKKKGGGENEDSLFLVELPYCQFVSIKKSKDSIHKIFNMPLRMAQKLAFQIYDRNGNGVIDQKDLIELFTEADSNQAIRQDLQIMIKHYSSSQLDTYRSSSIQENRLRGISFNSVMSVENSMRHFSQISEISLIPSTKRLARTDRDNPEKSLKFEKQKFYTFLESKNYFFEAKKNNNMAIRLQWSKFKKAFEGRRPKVYYDMLDYVFGLDSELLIGEAKNFVKVKIVDKEKKDLMKKTIAQKRMQNSSKDTISRMGSTKIGSMIAKVKSIQKFDSVTMT